MLGCNMIGWFTSNEKRKEESKPLTNLSTIFRDWSGDSFSFLGVKSVSIAMQPASFHCIHGNKGAKPAKSTSFNLAPTTHYSVIVSSSLFIHDNKVDNFGTQKCIVVADDLQHHS